MSWRWTGGKYIREHSMEASDARRGQSDSIMQCVLGKTHTERRPDGESKTDGINAKREKRGKGRQIICIFQDLIVAQLLSLPSLQ